MSVGPGSKLSHYRLAEKIGEGGMGAVYRASDEHLNRDVAVKILLEGTLADDDARRRFRREALALSKLNHPNIQTVYDFDTQQDVDFLVMELIPGETLSDRIAAGALAEKEILRLGVQIAAGLTAAHAEGIVHRDLKPANLRLTPDGRVKILDFGLARLTEPKADATETISMTNVGVVAGTVPYMAPEQLLGEQIDARTDVHALGAVLYEMATGLRAFHQEPTPRLTDAILHLPPAPPRSANAAVSERLEQVILKCLEKDPDSRYQSAKEVEVDLRRLQRDADSAQSAAVTAAPDRRPTRPRVGVMLAGLIVVLVAGAAGAFFLQRVRLAHRQQALLEELRPAIEAARLDEIYAVLDERGIEIDSSGMTQLAELVSGSLAIETEPAGIEVTAVRVQPVEMFEERSSIDLGRTPALRRLVAGEYLLTLERAGNGRLPQLVTVDVGRQIELRRDLAAPVPGRDMALVAAGPSPIAPDEGDVPAFLIDRYEVTNEDYLEFIGVGGYTDAGYWPESVVVDGRSLPWSEAIDRFVDRTGLPGPRSWSRGTHHEGQGRHPVTGVSWYEAAAYARWAGMELPTRKQWWRAALAGDGRAYPWGRDAKTAEQRANFGMDGTDPVGSHPLGVSEHGCFDLAGNVGEWLRDADPETGKHVVVGGSWQDPVYMFVDSQARRLERGYTDDATGFRLVMDVGGEE